MIIVWYLFSVVFFFILTLCLVFANKENIVDNGWMFLGAAEDEGDSASPMLPVVVSCIPIIRFMICLLIVMMGKYSTDEVYHTILKVLDEMEDTDGTRKMREQAEDFFRRY